MAGNSKSVKKSNETMKGKYGPDFQSRNGAAGGKSSTRGYFGKLKDEGRTDELKALSLEAANRSAKRSDKQKSASAHKGWATRKAAQE